MNYPNMGPAREVYIQGVPDGPWRAIRTDERDSFAEFPVEAASGGLLVVTAPERGLVTLTTP